MAMKTNETAATVVSADQIISFVDRIAAGATRPTAAELSNGDGVKRCCAPSEPIRRLHALLGIRSGYRLPSPTGI
jgi:hypothetical protein